MRAGCPLYVLCCLGSFRPSMWSECDYLCLVTDMTRTVPALIIPAAEAEELGDLHTGVNG